MLHVSSLKDALIHTVANALSVTSLPPTEDIISISKAAGHWGADCPPGTALS